MCYLITAGAHHTAATWPSPPIGAVYAGCWMPGDMRNMLFDKRRCTGTSQWSQHGASHLPSAIHRLQMPATYIYDPVYTGCEGHSKRPWAKGLGVYLMEFRGNDQPHTFFISQHLFLAFLGVSRQEKSLRAFRTPLTGKHAKSNNTEID